MCRTEEIHLLIYGAEPRELNDSGRERCGGADWAPMMGRPLLLDLALDTRVATSVAGVGLRRHGISGAIVAQPKKLVFARPASRFPMAFCADGPACTCVLCGLSFGTLKFKLERHLHGREHARTVREHAGLSRKKSNIARSMRSKKSGLSSEHDKRVRPLATPRRSRRS